MPEAARMGTQDVGGAIMSIRTTAAIYASMGLSAYANAFDHIPSGQFANAYTPPNVGEYMNAIPTVYPVLQPVRDNLKTDEYLRMTDEQFNAYIDAQYGDYDE